MYKFNPQHIAALSAGKVILGHTKKEEDLPLLRAVIKETFTKEVDEPYGENPYYIKSLSRKTWDYLTFIPNQYKHLPIIPLHDFLAKDELPKEDLDRIDLMDKRLKELEGIVKDNGNHEFIQWLTSIDVANKIVKMFEGEPKQEPKIAKRKDRTCTNNCKTICGECQIWEHNTPKEEQPNEVLPQGKSNLNLSKLESLLDTALSNETPETLKEWLLAKRANAEIPQDWQPQVGEWVYAESFNTYVLIECVDEQRVHGYNQSNKDPYHLLINGLRAATEEEVFNHLKSIAKKRYPVGAEFICARSKAKGTSIANFYMENGRLLSNALSVWFNGKWAEIAEPKETEPIPTFAVSIDETTIGHSYSVIIEQSNGALRKLKAKEIQSLIRWVLDNQETVIKLKNR
jgi:hypothetical protein